MKPLTSFFVIFTVGLIAGAYISGPVEYSEGVTAGKSSISCPVCTCPEMLSVEEAIRLTPTETPKWILQEICRKESGCQHYVKGGKGEFGAFQIHPVNFGRCGNLENTAESVKCADLIFSDCMDKTGRDIKASLCCYNGAELNGAGSCAYAER